jgi:hypothetical protein
MLVEAQREDVWASAFICKAAENQNMVLAIIRGLLLREPELDVLRMQDVGLRTEDDASILAWAAQEGRVLITSDASTVPDIAN